MARETLIGTMVTLPTPATAEILADAGFDWFFIDGEHGPLETPQILSILQTGASQGMCLLDDSLKQLIADGSITKEEALKHCDDPKRLGGA